MNIKVVGIDLAKNVFQVCVCLVDHSIKSNKKVSRTKLLDKIRQLPEGILIAMEACGTAHYWGRKFKELGHQVKLIPAQHIKPFVVNQKNDVGDEIVTEVESYMRFYNYKRIHSGLNYFNAA